MSGVSGYTLEEPGKTCARGDTWEEAAARPLAVSAADAAVSGDVALALSGRDSVDALGVREILDGMTATVADLAEWRSRRSAAAEGAAAVSARVDEEAVAAERGFAHASDNDDFIRRATAQLSASSHSSREVGAGAARREPPFPASDDCSLSAVSHADALRQLTAESFAQRASTASAAAGRRDPLVASALDDSKLTAARRAAGAAAALGQLDASALQMHAALLARQRMRELGLEDDDAEGGGDAAAGAGAE